MTGFARVAQFGARMREQMEQVVRMGAPEAPRQVVGRMDGVLVD